MRVIAAPKMQMNMPRVSPDGKSVAFIGGLMSDWGSVGGDVYTVPLAGGAPTDVTPNYKGTFEGLDWRGGKLMATAQIGDRSAAVTIDPVSKSVTVSWSAPVSVSSQDFAGPLAFAADGAVAATVMQDFTHAPEIALGKLPALAPVTHANAAWPATVAAQSVHWKSEEFDVQGWLLEPDQSRARQASDDHHRAWRAFGGVAAALYRGGRPARHRLRFRRALHRQRGYFVFYPNPRGSYGQGEAFTRANIRDFGGGDLRDILAGIDAVENSAPVDDARLGLVRPFLWRLDEHVGQHPDAALQGHRRGRGHRQLDQLLRPERHRQMDDPLLRRLGL